MTKEKSVIKLNKLKFWTLVIGFVIGGTIAFFAIKTLI